MPLLTGLSHAVIFFNTLDGSKKTGVSAMCKLCFGSDTDALAQILYRIEDGNTTPVWVLPHRGARIGVVTTEEFPVLTGKMGEEVLAAVGRAADRLKKAGIVGKLAGRSFRVTKTTVEEIKAETETTKQS